MTREADDYDPEQDEWAQTFRDCGYEFDHVCREWHRPGYTCVRCFCDESPHPPPQCVIEGEIVRRMINS